MSFKTEVNTKNSGVKPLTSTQLVQLIKLAKKGNLNARNKILLANQGLIVKLIYAGKYNKNNFADLAAEANLGLIRAIEKFEPERGCQFSTYAKWWILDSLGRATKNLNLVAKPRQKSTATNQVQEPQPVYLEENKCNLKSLKANPYKLAKYKYRSLILKDLLKQLTTREKLIICKDFGLNYKYSENNQQLENYLEINALAHIKIRKQVLKKFKHLLASKGIYSYKDL